MRAIPTYVRRVMTKEAPIVSSSLVAALALTAGAGAEQTASAPGWLPLLLHRRLRRLNPCGRLLLLHHSLFLPKNPDSQFAFS